ncbi:MAG: DegT/DnrJ/EryC1/StrS family aminotransferase [Actinobacteria bacterium]|nr:DegT/DnrJ/EryC1/StrS family aminotransferase [Actinomycetota bacterium]
MRPFRRVRVERRRTPHGAGARRRRRARARRDRPFDAARRHPRRRSGVIPLVDLAAQHREIADEVLAGWQSVLERTAFVLGDEVTDFEREFAGYTGVAHCIGVGSGTDALELGLRACGVEPGDEVILPANTFVATAFAVDRAGATPVFVDVDPDSYLLDVQQVKARLGPRTRAVIPVHLYGQLAPMEDLLDLLAGNDVAVVEDAAQCQGAHRHGKHAGTFGAVAATSFYPGKNLGAYGDAGAVLTESDELARRIRALRNYGGEAKYEHPERGFNSRLDTLQAVVLLAKLRRLDRWNAARAAAAARYTELLGPVEAVTVPSVAPGNEHVWHLYVIRVPERDRVLAALHRDGIGAGIHYPVPVHLQGAFAGLGYSDGDFPVTESAARSIVSLPMYPTITPEQQERVVDAVQRAVRG